MKFKQFQIPRSRGQDASGFRVVINPEAVTMITVDAGQAMPACKIWLGAGDEDYIVVEGELDAVVAELQDGYGTTEELGIE